MAKRMNQQQFVDAVRTRIPDCEDPLALKQQLEYDLGFKMDFAETLTFIGNYDQTGEQLTNLRELLLKDRSLGHDRTRPPDIRGIIPATGRRKNEGGARRPTEEIASRLADKGPGKER